MTHSGKPAMMGVDMGAGAAPFEYTVYVHKDDLALAESAIQGTVG